MHTLAILNEKGGAGKTTTAVNLAAALGELGRRVLLVDMDGQAATSRWLGVEGDTRLVDALRDPEQEKALEPIPEIWPGVSLAPGHATLDAAAHLLKPAQTGRLRDVLAPLRRRFDVCLIDSPPGLAGRLVANTIVASTHALIPVETSVLALDGLKAVLRALQDLQTRYGHDMALVGVVACRFDVRTRLSGEVLTELLRALGRKVFATTIRENVRLRECPASGQSILTFAPESNGAADYRALAREVEKRL